MKGMRMRSGRVWAQICVCVLAYACGKISVIGLGQLPDCNKISTLTTDIYLFIYLSKYVFTKWKCSTDGVILWSHRPIGRQARMWDYGRLISWSPTELVFISSRLTSFDLIGICINYQKHSSQIFLLIAFRCGNTFLDHRRFKLGNSSKSDTILNKIIRPN